MGALAASAASRIIFSTVLAGLIYLFSSRGATRRWATGPAAAERPG
jgi:hypothetical protein